MFALLGLSLDTDSWSSLSSPSQAIDATSRQLHYIKPPVQGRSFGREGVWRWESIASFLPLAISADRSFVFVLPPLREKERSASVMPPPNRALSSQTVRAEQNVYIFIYLIYFCICSRHLYTSIQFQRLVANSVLKGRSKYVIKVDLFIKSSRLGLNRAASWLESFICTSNNAQPIS